MQKRKCRKCGRMKLAAAEFFNILPSGSFRGTCKTCMAENTRKHYRMNPDKVKARVDKYKIKLAQADGTYFPEDINAIREKLRDKCFYCGAELNGGGEVDHKLPISRGGSNWPSNLTLACRTCNRDKNNKTSDEFMIWRKDKFSDR